MCQLFALSANTPVDIRFSFTGFSARGGRTGDHADGFGVAFHDGPVCQTFVDAGRAADAPLAAFLRQHPYRAKVVLAHVRKATQGDVQLANCHPFVREWQGQHWSFSHNGTLKNFRVCRPGHFRPVGSTDSELAFCWMLNRLRRRYGDRPLPGWRAVGPQLAELAHELSAHGSFNFMLSNGRALIVHCSTALHALQRQHPFGEVHLIDEDLSLDLDIAHGPKDRMCLIATAPLTRNEPWEALAPGEMRIMESGTTVWRGSSL